MVEQEGEAVVLLQQLSEEAAVRSRVGLPVPPEGVARVRVVRGFAQDVDLREVMASSTTGYLHF